jgi:hypothetical protein
MLYEITVFGTYFNQQIVNRFNYVSTGVPASVSGSFALMNAFGAVFSSTPPAGLPLTSWMAYVSNEYKITNIIVRAPADYAVEDFYERPFPTPYGGGNSNEGLSPTSAFGFRTSRVRLDIARGTKRLVGVCETQTDAGGNLTSTAIANMTTVADDFSDTLTYDDEGNTITFSPCVVQKVEYETPKGTKAYRYYPTLAQQLEHIALGVVWSPYTTVRTQTSRQYARGV